MAKTRIAATLILCLAGAALGLVLLSKHYGVPLLGEAALAACGEGGGCDIVSQSRWSSFLGLPLAAWGLLLYGVLAALVAPSLSGGTEESGDAALSLGFLIAVLAVTVDLGLLGLQALVIKAFCKFCIATYFVNLLIVASLWPFRSTAAAGRFLSASSSRRALVSWIIASLATLAAAGALNSALDDRKALAGNSILGVPTGTETPQSAPLGSAEEQLAEARAEAKKWKDTLDDDRKLQAYLNQKARDAYNQTPVTKVDLSRAPAQGPSNAPIAVVTYSDFMCPFCRDLAGGLRGFLPTAGGQVKIHYKQFPLDTTCNPQAGQTLHPGACELALGSICAEESGRFWEYHDKVFAQRWERASREDVLGIGASVGLDRAKLGACMNTASTKGLLAKDIDEGWKIGVSSTPAIFVNGRRLQNPGSFLIALDEERKRLKLSPPSAPSQPSTPAKEE